MSRILNSKILSVILVGVLVWLGVSFLDVKFQERYIHDEVQNLQNKIEAAKKDNTNLEKNMANLQNPSFLEREAKLKLNYKKSDEQVVFVYRDTAPKKGSESFQSKLAGMKNYQKWWYWLIGYR